MWWAPPPSSPPSFLLAAAVARAPPPFLLAAAVARAPPPPRTATAVSFNSSPFLKNSGFIFSPRFSSSPLRLSSMERDLRGCSVSAVMLQDAGVTTAVLAGAYALVRGFDELTKQNLIKKSLSRKVVHVLSGLLYMSSWPFFSSSPEARYFAAIVPLLNSIRLIVYGLRLVNDEGLIKSITREGKAEELLRGPLYYVIVLMFCALVFWRESPIGIVAVAMMSGGDGFADIVGRRYGAEKLPYNRQKSLLGSISMFIFGYLCSIGMLYYFSAFGYIDLDWKETIKNLAVVSLVATMVESLPLDEFLDDNISVPLISMLMVSLVFGYSPS